jgi:hypothetical protein
VVAIIPGSDPALRNEYVLLSAHLDHVGIRGEATGQRNIAGAEDDRIFNGAMDNATGIATLLEVARKFMEPGNRPKRSILIAAVTAEEDGLLGSKYLARNPVVPGKIVANVNLDMPILTYAFRTWSPSGPSIPRWDRSSSARQDDERGADPRSAAAGAAVHAVGPLFVRAGRHPCRVPDDGLRRRGRAEVQIVPGERISQPEGRSGPAVRLADGCALCRA